MKSTLGVVLSLLIFPASIFAQISPTPVSNNEMRDGTSIRRRSMELEIVKRDTDKPTINENTKEEIVRFTKIKEDFENIQKIEDEIIKTYTLGKKINFKKISELSTELSRKAVRLDNNLFVPKTDKQKVISNILEKPKSVRDLIIDLDAKIGNFIKSPIFSDTKLVDSKNSEKSQFELENIIHISKILAQEALKN